MKRFVNSHPATPFRRRSAALPGFNKRARESYRLPASLLLGGLLGFAAFTGCRHAPPVTPPPVETPVTRVILDYRNGWYHKANGSETIAQIAAHYHRDVDLVIELNLAGGPTSIPQAGMMLYVPPGNDRQMVHNVLTRLQGHPELIPKKPWDPDAATAATATVSIKNGDGGTREVNIKPAEPAQPSNPLAAKSPAGELAKIEPPAPGKREITLAEAPAAKKTGFFGWFSGGSTANTALTGKKPLAATPRPTPKSPLPAKTEAFLWPVKGQVVTTYKGGWVKPFHGIEIAANEGTPVRAARAGKVLLAREYPGYGNMILIDHGDGFSTVYGYNRQILVKENQHVERGQTISSVGRPTQGSTSKLLFQVRRNPLPVDPMTYLKDS